MARITAEEAGRIVMEEQRKLNNSRRLPVTLDRIRVLMQEEAFPICNVGPWTHQIRRGPISFDIPGYDPALDDKNLGYAESALQPSVHRMAKIIDEHEFGWFEDDGHYVARDLIGVGFGLHPHNSLVQYGVFVPEGKHATATEIAAAKGQLSAYRDRLIQEARDAYDKGPAERAATIGERHLWAARSVGLNEKWVHGQHTQESVQCASCGRFNAAGVAKCQCGMILDFDLHFKIETEQRRRLAEYELDQQTKPDHGKK
jgi:hypothetical protein